MTIEEIRETDWYKERPEVIKQAIELLPPTQLYMFKTDGKQCTIYSYEEPKSGKIEDVTITVQKTGIGGVLSDIGLGIFDTNLVFGVKIDDLELYQ